VDHAKEISTAMNSLGASMDECKNLMTWWVLLLMLVSPLHVCGTEGPKTHIGQKHGFRVSVYIQ
jgi:hypothetical protein